ncbi:hypothetical protein GE09DRAFT_1058016 [Coniochaeta sp. 2T2.1]|nr:hypothetical protein GE09DRAFT_1058016 [Coniochaeta sp. 2T2.1]
MMVGLGGAVGGGSHAARPGPGPVQQQQRRPYGVACLGCRRVKMRCIITEQEGKCERCTRLRKDCVFETHRRGLWKRNSRPSAAEPLTTMGGTMDNGITNPNNGQRSFSNSAPIPISATMEIPDPTMSAFPDITSSFLRSGDRQHSFDAPRPPDINSNGNGNGSFPPPTFRQHSTASTTSPNTTLDSRSPPCSAAQSPGKEERGIRFNVASFVPTDVDAGDLAVDVALDTQRRIMEGSSSSRSHTSSSDRDKSWQEYDPIHMKLLSRPAAEVLFDGFIKNFNLLAAYLDPDLYTFNYTREASNLLFTACLAIAATVFRPELYRSLKEHQEMLLGKALLACDASVETVWTLCLLNYWKDVGDRRGYNLVGFAIQLAKSAEWNKTRRPRSLSQTEKNVPTRREMEVHVRQRRDKDLAWLLLGALDRTTSIFTNRPLTNPPITDATTRRSWIESEPESWVWGCTRHVAGYELTTIIRPVFDLILQTDAECEIEDDDAATRASRTLAELQERMKTFNDGMDGWETHWYPYFVKVAPFQQQSQIIFYGEYMKLHFNSILLHRILVSNDDDVNDPAAINALSICYTASINVLTETRNFGQLDLLYYFWDSAHLVSAFAAMMLLKVLNLSSALPETAAADALEVLTGLLVVYTNTAQAMAWRPDSGGGSKAPAVESDKVPVANGLEAQVRLLRSIVATITSRFEVAEGNNPSSSTRRMGVPVSAPTPPPWAQHVPPECRGDSAVDLTEVSGNNNGQGQQDLNYAVTELVGDMDFSLDASYMDAKFNAAGLMGWDEMGIFAD